MNTIISRLMPANVAMMAAGGRGSAKGEAAPDAPAPVEGGVAAQIADARGEETAASVPALHVSEDQPVVINGRAFKVRQVTRNVFPQRPGHTLLVQMQGKIYTGKALDNPGPNGKMDPAELAEVVNLETGEIGLIIINTVLGKQFEENYPNAGYVGKSFAITMKDIPGKRYKQFTLFELEAA